MIFSYVLQGLLNTMLPIFINLCCLSILDNFQNQSKILEVTCYFKLSQYFEEIPDLAT